MGNKPTLAPRLNCEQLEDRANPDGNIAVGVSNGVIFLAGDAFNNAAIVQMNQFGDTVITGVNNTLINGLPSLYLGRWWSNGLIADMGAGNDALEVDGLAAYGPISVAGNIGDDTTVLRGVAASDIGVGGGYGNDNTFVSVAQAWTITLDGGPGLDYAHADHTINPNGFFLYNTEVPY